MTQKKKTYSWLNVIVWLILLPFLIICYGSTLNAQTLITDGISDAKLSDQAILHLQSKNNDKGFLLPRVALTAANLPKPMTKHIAGLVVYNTATAGIEPFNVLPGIYSNDGAMWQAMSIEKNKIGDLKYSMKSNDHMGWYLLDGRKIDSLPTAFAKVSANNLGFSVHIPNAADRFVRTTAAGEKAGVMGGSYSFKIVQDNMPNFDYSVTFSPGGLHNHIYSNASNTVKTYSATNNFINGVEIYGLAVKSLTSSTDEASHQHDISFRFESKEEEISLTPKHLVTNIFIYLGI